MFHVKSPTFTAAKLKGITVWLWGNKMRTREWQDRDHEWEREPLLRERNGNVIQCYGSGTGAGLKNRSRAKLYVVQTSVLDDVVTSC